MVLWKLIVDQELIIDFRRRAIWSFRFDRSEHREVGLPKGCDGKRRHVPRWDIGPWIGRFPPPVSASPPAHRTNWKTRLFFRVPTSISSAIFAYTNRDPQYLQFSSLSQCLCSCRFQFHPYLSPTCNSALPWSDLMAARL